MLRKPSDFQVMLYLVNDHGPMYEKKEKKVKKVKKRLARMKGCGRKYNHKREGLKKGKRDQRKMEKDTYVLSPEIKLTYFLQKYSQTLSTNYLSSI